MSLRISRSVTVRTLAAIALLSSAGAAFAQKAALVENIDDGVRAPYQEGVFASGCNLAGNCAILFTRVPAGHRRVIEHLSCFISLASGSLTSPITLNSDAFRNARDFLVPTFVSSGIYTANGPVLLYYEAGETPRADAFSSGPYGTFLCTVSGRDITLP